MYHLRFTPDDISGYTFDFLDQFAAYIVAFENKDKFGDPAVNHYHILIDTDYGIQTVRNAVKASLKIPKSGQGRNNKYYMLNDDWKDPSYIVKYYDIRKSKGYTEKQILDFAIEGQKKYLKKKEAPLTIVVEKKKTQSVDRLVSADILQWYHEQDSPPDKRAIIRKACELYRSRDKGINKFKVRDIVMTLYFDVHTTRDSVIEDIYDIC